MEKSHRLVQKEKPCSLFSLFVLSDYVAGWITIVHKTKKQICSEMSAAELFLPLALPLHTESTELLQGRTSAVVLNPKRFSSLRCTCFSFTQTTHMKRVTWSQRGVQNSIEPV